MKTAIICTWAISAKNWFTGPKVMGTKEELMAIERELDALEHGAVPQGMETAVVEHPHGHSHD
ncbi:MAG TPA: hypothetical protein PLV13_08045 [Ilumatobacteraceae bacterium]|nr:hypothetical protein [Ilumatobacteraceae bacterium]